MTQANSQSMTARTGAKRLSVQQIMKALEAAVKGAHVHFVLTEGDLSRAVVYFDLESTTFVTRYSYSDGDTISVPEKIMLEVANQLYHHKATMAAPKPVELSEAKRAELFSDDYADVQRVLGCAGCRFCDSEKLGRGPCCTLPRLNRIDSENHCLDRREPVPPNWQCEECHGDLRQTGWEHVLLVDRDTVVCPKCADAIRRRAA